MLLIHRLSLSPEYYFSDVGTAYRPLLAVYDLLLMTVGRGKRIKGWFAWYLIHFSRIPLSVSYPN